MFRFFLAFEVLKKSGPKWPLFFFLNFCCCYMFSSFSTHSGQDLALGRLRSLNHEVTARVLHGRRDLRAIISAVCLCVNFLSIKYAPSFLRLFAIFFSPVLLLICGVRVVGRRVVYDASGYFFCWCAAVIYCCYFMVALKPDYDALPSFLFCDEEPLLAVGFY